MYLIIILFCEVHSRLQSANVTMWNDLQEKLQVLSLKTTTVNYKELTITEVLLFIIKHLEVCLIRLSEVKEVKNNSQESIVLRCRRVEFLLEFTYKHLLILARFSLKSY